MSLKKQLRGYYDYDFRSRGSLEKEITRIKAYTEYLEEELASWQARLRELENERRYLRE